MSSISTVEAKLPPGFRFHPKDEELVCDYLMKKVTHCDSSLMIDVDLNKCEPWDIPEVACVGGKEWYFYTQRDRKYATGLRTNRATASGYWKATGKDRPILRKTTLVGMRKTLVFYQGRAPKGRKTEWVMHEFRLEGPLGPPRLSSAKEDWVLCRAFLKHKDPSAKQSIAGCYDDVGCSSLPALMDSYISFDQQAQAQTHQDDYEQVPCFSIFSQIHTNPNFNHTGSTSIMQPNLVEPVKNHSVTATYCGGTTPYDLDSSCLDPNLNFNGDSRKVLKAFVDQLAKIERNKQSQITTLKGSPSFGEASPESFLSDVCTPNLWNTF